MKVAIGSNIKKNSFGGGNLFAINLQEYLYEKKCMVVNSLIDKDIDIILEIKDLLYNKKYTIDGARNSILKKSDPSNSHSMINEKQKVILSKIKIELKSILDLLSS